MIVFMHTKKPNMVNYTTGIYNNCTSQGVKTGLSKKYFGWCVATYFHGHGTQTWCLKCIVTCWQIIIFSTKIIETYAVDNVNSSWHATFEVFKKYHKVCKLLFKENNFLGHPWPSNKKWLTSNFKSGWCQLYTTITNIMLIINVNKFEQICSSM
jgi:hypothetical protein